MTIKMNRVPKRNETWLESLFSFLDFSLWGAFESLRRFWLSLYAAGDGLAGLSFFIGEFSVVICPSLPALRARRTTGPLGVALTGRQGDVTQEAALPPFCGGSLTAGRELHDDLFHAPPISDSVPGFAAEGSSGPNRRRV